MLTVALGGDVVRDLSKIDIVGSGRTVSMSTRRRSKNSVSAN